MATKRINNTLHEVFDIGVGADVLPLVAGTPQAITTGIQLTRDYSLADNDANKWNYGLNAVQVEYQEITNTGGAVVRETDIVITAGATGLVVITLVNTGVPGSESAGKLRVYKKHTATL